MKAFVIATLFVASCSASYYGGGAISTQYQSHDGHGAYKYGYSDPLSTKDESKSHDGTVHGGYSYVDAHGHVQSVKYVADPHKGFEIIAATNLPKGPSPAAYAYAPLVHGAPVPVEKTHDVLVAEHAHFAAVAEAKARVHYHEAPAPVKKTHEVLAAEHAHFAAVAEAKARVHHHYKRSIYEYAPAPVNGVPVDTAEVQHAKAKHLAAVSEANAKAAQSSHYAPAQNYNDNSGYYHDDSAQYNHAPAHYNHAPAHYNHAPAKAYNHYAYQPAPAPVNGVPVDTAEVKHATAHHLAAVAEAKAKIGYSAHYAPAQNYNDDSAHYNHAPSQQYYGNGNGQEDDGSYDARRYETENYH